MAERIVMPGTHHVKPHVQTAAEDRDEYNAVTARDKECQAPLIDPACDPCSGRLTREHVRYAAAMGGKRITTRNGMLCLCLHHQLDGWATSHKPQERDWLKGMKA
jgi:hypothetical protein